MKRSTSAAALLLASLCASQASADVIQWQPQYSFDNGTAPSVALGYAFQNAWEVEVHQGQATAGPLWYTSGVGPYRQRDILGNWTQYSYGAHPSIANLDERRVGDAQVVEVHQFGDNPGALFSNIGEMQSLNGIINWSNFSYYETNGWHPSVAAHSGVAVEVHMEGNGAALGYAPLYYLVGSGSAAGFAWGLSAQYDNGVNPSVAIYGSTVVEVHQGGTGVGPLWYHVGTINGSTITWGPSRQYDNGINPSVSFSSEGTLIEVHQGAVGPSALWYHVGMLMAPFGGQIVLWSASNQYDFGEYPKVSWNQPADDGVEVHQAAEGVSALWSHPFERDLLGVPLDPQKQANWCWAASTQMVASYEGVSISQCDEENHSTGRTDCCSSAASASDTGKCNVGGWPDFNYYGFNASIGTVCNSSCTKSNAAGACITDKCTATGTAALSFAQLQAELGANHPVEYAWKWSGLGGHMMVVTGADTINGVQYVTINDPDPVNVGDQTTMTYAAWVSGAGYQHWRDYYGIAKK
ncbi:MAG: papain-like cysteine protease family protein [Polyangiales bacterium]